MSLAEHRRRQSKPLALRLPTKFRGQPGIHHDSPGVSPILAAFIPHSTQRQKNPAENIIGPASDPICGPYRSGQYTLHETKSSPLKAATLMTPISKIQKRAPLGASQAQNMVPTHCTTSAVQRHRRFELNDHCKQNDIQNAQSSRLVSPQLARVDVHKKAVRQRQVTFELTSASAEHVPGALLLVRKVSGLTTG